MKTILLLIALAATAMAQKFDLPCFTAEAARWTNHDFPELIKPHLPLIPGNEKDGVQVFIGRPQWQAESCVDSRFVLMRIRYRTATGVARVHTSVVPLNYDEVSGKVGGYEVAIVGKDVTVTKIEIDAIHSSDEEDKQ